MGPSVGGPTASPPVGGRLRRPPSARSPGSKIPPDSGIQTRALLKLIAVWLNCNSDALTLLLADVDEDIAFESYDDWCKETR